MKVVNLSDTQGNVKQRRVGFSLKFLFFGPLYLFAKIHIFSGFLITLLYYYLLPIPGMHEIGTFISQIFPYQYQDMIYRFLIFFRTEYAQYVGISLVVLLQIIISFFVEGLLLRRSIKAKKLLPVTEEDARILISIHACNTKIELASDKLQRDRMQNNYSLKNRDKEFPYIIGDIDNSKIATFKRATLRKKIEELNELYTLGQLTREEYEVRRTKIKNDYK